MPDTTRTDTEFVSLYSEEIAKVYQEAKAIAGLAPRNCLLDLRRLIESIVADLAEHLSVSVEKLNLSDSINKIRSEKNITPALLDKIDKIRKVSNKQIHRPIETLDNSGNDQVLAQDSLKLFCDVIATYRTVVRRETDNSYQFVPDGTADLMKICYEAFFKESDNLTETGSTYYRLAKVLLEDLYRNAGKINSSFELKRDTYIKLVELGANNIGWHEAVCDYAYLKLYGDKLLGYEPETDNEALNQTVDKLHRFCEYNSQNMRLKVLYAQATILKGYGEQWEKSFAYNELKQAVASRDAEAIMTLAEMYYRGFYVEEDHLEAFRLFAEAAELGDASALYMLGEMLQTEKKWDESLQKYSAAAQQGLHTAYLNVARVHSQLKQHKEAIKAYSLYLNSRFTFVIQTNPATLELGEQIILDADKDPIGILKGLSQITAVVQRFSPTPEQKGQANRIAGNALKLLKDRITSDMERNNVFLLHSFDPKGKIKSFKNTWPNGLPPEPNQIYDFKHRCNPAGSSKKNKVKFGRNDPCPCKSGVKYKNCNCGTY